MYRDHEHKVSSGWVLYYSEEGYPYYYNEATGESEWAEHVEDSSSYYVDAPQDGYEGAGMNGYDDIEEDGEEEEEEDSDQEGIIDSDDEEEDDDSEPIIGEETIVRKLAAAKVLDKILEAKFREYLQTEDGMAAAEVAYTESELRRIGKKIEKRQSQRSSQQEQEYLRDLIRNKKKDDPTTTPLAVGGGLSTAYSNLVQLTHAWMFPVDESQSLGSKRKKVGLDAAASSRDPGPPVALQSPSSSRSSSVSSSSETDSVSSDDSDIAEIDSPLFSDLPAWLSLSTLTTYVQSVIHSTSAFISSSSSSSAASTHTSHRSSAQTSIAASSTAIANRGMYYVGGLCLEGLNALFHKVNPLLEAFFQSIVDGDADVTVSDADAVSPSTARRAICNPSLTAIHSSSSTPRHNSIQPASHTVHSTTSPTDNI